MSDDLQALLKKLDDIGGNIDESVKKGLKRAANKIKADAKRLAPTDEGRLRNSIVDKVYTENNDTVATVGSALQYAPYVEFGTGSVGEQSPKLVPEGLNLKYRNSGWSYQDENGDWIYTKGQPAQPFLYPAFKQNEKDIAGYISKSIKSDIRGLMGD